MVGDLHITNSMKTMRMLTKHRSRNRLHLKFWFSHLIMFWLLIAPHQKHLKAGTCGETSTRSPQPQHVVSSSSLTDVTLCSSYNGTTLRN